MKYLYQNPLYRPERTTYLYPHGFINFFDDLITEIINPDSILVDGNHGASSCTRPVGSELMSDINEVRLFNMEVLEDTKANLNFKLQPKDILVFYSLSHLLKNLYDDQPLNKITYFRSLQVDVHFYDENFTLRFTESDDYLYGQLDTLLKMNNFCNAMVQDNNDSWRKIKNR